MKIRLVSQDAALQKLCREILEEFPNREYELSVALSVNGAIDLCIWDYDEQLGLPSVQDEEELAKYLILLPRKDIPAVRRSPRYATATLLLKPVTHAALRAFLGQAISTGKDRTANSGSLRADRDEILQCFIEANLRLQEQDQDRSNFIARGLHDFRAPLTAISGYCGLLLSEVLGPMTTEQQQVLQRMQNSAKRLSRMASGMFQLSVERHSKRRPDLRKSDLQDCLDQALHEVSSLTASKHISILAELDEKHRILPCEPDQVEQLFVNILDNACKFTPRNGEIEIRGYPYFWDRRSSRALLPGMRERRWHHSHEPNSYCVEIRNSGACIPDQYLESIFEEYTSYAGALDRSGAGLGLAICRMIALQHDGRIWVENTESGPKFTVVLPVYPFEPAPANDNNHTEMSKYAEVFE